ncbi:MAG: Uma2 family endonuclease [Anaerolineae bacterium]|nr:Uma2 family endonuclease [Anaerolineae bacterium]
MLKSLSLLTVEDFACLSEGDSHYELAQGRLVVTGLTGGEHGALIVEVGAALRAYVAHRQLGVVLLRTGYCLARNPDTVRSPDVSFLRQERIPASGLPRGYIDGPPDLAVEIVSPGDRAEDIEAKVQDYLAYGTRLIWVVQPRTRTVTVYYPDGQARVLRGEDRLNGEDVVPGFTLALADLWG